MANTIKLNYQITNAKAAETADPDKYLVLTEDDAEKSDYTLPIKLLNKMTKIQIGQTEP